jgi:hypothetical protein
MSIGTKLGVRDAAPPRAGAVGYCRGSTKRQADHQISLDEQEKG